MTDLDASGSRRSLLAQAGAGGLGFTLLELLVVIGLVGLLVMLVLPGLARAKTVVRSTQCKSNVRQLTMGLHLYVDDHNFYPRFADWARPEPTYWPELFAPYVSAPVPGQGEAEGRKTVFLCPSGLAATSWGTALPTSYGYSDEGYALQGLGERIVESDGTCRTRAVHESEVVLPSDTIALGDGMTRTRSGKLRCTGLALRRWELWLPGQWEGGWRWTDEELKAADQVARRLHGGQANVGFCDGHVEGNRVHRLFEEMTDTALRRWNRDHEPHRECLEP